MKLFGALFQLARAATTLTINFVRLACTRIALPILKLAERLGAAAAATENAAKEYEERLKEQEASLK